MLYIELTLTDNKGKIMRQKNYTRLTTEAKELYDELSSEFNDADILAALEDGEYLKSVGITQDTAEELHTTLKDGEDYKPNWS